MTSLVAVIAPHTDKIIKMASMFLKKENICYKMVRHITLCIYVKPIVRNRVTMLEFTQTKSDFSERGLTLKGLMLE